jgi:hypothetical protein
LHALDVSSLPDFVRGTVAALLFEELQFILLEHDSLIWLMLLETANLFFLGACGAAA